MKAEPLHERMVQQLEKVICAFTSAYPDTTEEFATTFRTSVTGYLKAWIGVLYLLIARIPSSRKYFFEAFRNRELMECLEPSEICVLGSRNDRAECRRRGFGFIWTGGIVAAMIAARKGGTGSMLPLQLQIGLAVRRFKGRRRYFVLYEDTLPIGIFFALLGESTSQATLCIEHGSPSIAENTVVDGGLCRYNLLYEMSHREYIPSTKSTYFELGPPFDVEQANTSSNEVVLVGTGLKTFIPNSYFKSIDTFQAIAAHIKKLGFDVAYRPHPNENLQDFTVLFAQIDNSSKVECLSTRRKVFVGYSSTLLYEASITGHAVVLLIDPSMPTIPLTPHVRIGDGCLDAISRSIAEAKSQIQQELVPRIRPLRDRFQEILAEIDLLEA